MYAAIITATFTCETLRSSFQLPISSNLFPSLLFERVLSLSHPLLPPQRAAEGVRQTLHPSLLCTRLVWLAQFPVYYVPELIVGHIIITMRSV